ncbi:hypothetical protein M011DRAFT_464557 [Sporormia fimetaria CBS 119925]|uniref:SWI5-dependent HO expression protein 3 n=1 Tax=Sporormia fimetaria CBS 119925 TaxID=1340428 RepID=A0A6A6VNL0_9PLEO|nr:hypothetical protein M011DRAFT_464557 [Sporormia fimetaria CBS 119925]
MAIHMTPRQTGPLTLDSSPASTSDPNTSAQWRLNPLNNSKTSQYIERVTAENQRLKLALNAEKALREEEAKRVLAAKAKAEDSRTEHEHLRVLADANARAIERKDRKIEELRAALETEVQRRVAAEQRAEDALRILGDNRSETLKKVASANEMMGRAEANAEAVVAGYKRKLGGYEKQVKVLTAAVNEVKRERREDADKIRRQAIVSEQLQHEVTRALRKEAGMRELLDEYKREYREEVDKLVEEAEKLRVAVPRKEEECEKLIGELERTRDKMLWVMAQKRREDGG